MKRGVSWKSGSENLFGGLMRGEWVTVGREGTEYKGTQKRVTVWSGEVGQSAEEGHPLKVLGRSNTRRRRRGSLETVTHPGGLTLSLLGSGNDKLRPGSLYSHGKNRQRSWAGGGWFG